MARTGVRRGRFNPLDNRVLVLKFMMDYHPDVTLSSQGTLVNQGCGVHQDMVKVSDTYKITTEPTHPCRQGHMRLLLFVPLTI